MQYLLRYSGRLQCNGHISSKSAIRQFMGSGEVGDLRDESGQLRKVGRSRGYKVTNFTGLVCGPNTNSYCHSVMAHGYHCMLYYPL